MGLKIVTGRTGYPHVTSNQIQAFNRAFLGDFALLDIGQHLDAVVRDANTIRIYDGCIVIQGVYAIIPYDEFEDILVEPVSVGNTRIDTIYLHYAKDMETDTETVEIDIAQGEEAVNNPVKPDIDLGGDIWEGETDIRVPLYDVTITSFDMTLTAYEYMNTYLPDISELSEKIPENIVSGVKGNAEETFRNGNVNLTAGNIGIEANTTETSTDVLTTIEIDGVVYSIAGGGSESDIPTIAEAIKQWDTSGYTIDLYGIGLPDTYYPASSTYSGNRYLDVNTGIMYDCEQTGADAYTWHQAPVNLRLKTDINASAIEDIQEDIAQSLSATGNPLSIESSESNLVECTTEVEAYQDLNGYDHPWVGGAGKNKLPMTVEGIKSANTDGTWSGNAYTINSGTLTIQTDSDGNVTGIKANGTFNALTTFILCPKFSDIPLTNGTSYTVNGNATVREAYLQIYDVVNNAGVANVGNGYTMEYSSSTMGNNAVIVRIDNTGHPNNTILLPMLRLSTETDSIFEPYENKSSITGQTEVVIEDAGKNLFNGQFENGYYDSSGKVYSVDWKRSVEYIDVVGGQNYVLSGELETLGNYSSNGIFFYTKDGSYLAYALFNIDALTFSKSVVTPQNCAKIGFYFRANANIKQTQLELSSTPTSYEPYKGKTYRLEIGQKNKLPMTVDGIKSANTSGSWNGNAYTVNGVTFTILTDSDSNVTGIKANGTASANAILNLGGQVTIAGTCILNGCPSGGGLSSYELQTASGGATYRDNGSGVQFPLSSSGGMLGVALIIRSGYTANNLIFYPMVRFSTETDSTFVPYNPNLPDAIYGGELDVITGELTVTHGEVDLGDLDYIYESSWGVSSDFYTNDIQNAVKAPLNDSTIANAICSQYKIVSRNTIYNSSESAIAILTNGIMKIRDSRYTSASDFKTAVTGQKFVYELAEPYTIQLPPQQIRLLKGTNHLSCNTGDLSIKYYPDNVLGQLKGDIEDEIDAVANRIKGVKTMQISGGAVSTDGSIMFTNLIGSIIVGTSISNDANSDKCVGIPYSMGTVPALKIMNESTMSVLSNIHISGILYYIEL